MVQQVKLTQHPHVEQISDILQKKFPYFLGVLGRQYEQFGDEWLSFFEYDLEKFFKSDQGRIFDAVKGYGTFALDAMKLQVKFQKTGEYENKTYEEAAQEVYQNRDYMFNLYLPGILLSHFLWYHHYKQHIFFMDEFLPLVKEHGGKKFYDIGVGTGFYSKEMLRLNPEFEGEGFDMSPFSLEHTTIMLQAHGLLDRYTPNLRNIITQPVETPAPFLVNIEVLEHLEDPQEFLDHLANMLEVGGYGLISAAINAPNADHIYLYRNAGEVKEQIEKAGFKVIKFIEDQGYEPRTEQEVVPVNAAFIVTK